jgi:Ssp1 endopeptidase immunity protein Rap1a
MRELAGCRALRIAAVIAAGVLLAHGPPVEASDPKSGTHWLRMCTSPEAYGQIECANYVRALVDYDELRAQLGERRHICAKKGLTIGESREAVVHYLRDKATDLSRPFIELAHDALKAAFPCPADAGSAPPATQR